MESLPAFSPPVPGPENSIPELPPDFYPPDYDKLSLTEKGRLLWEATRAAGTREEALSFKEKLKGRFWDYSKGQAKGYLRGFLTWLGEWLSPSSGLYRNTPGEILRQIEGADEEALKFLLEYMDSDWERRGELTGEATGQIALWGLEIYFFAKKLPKSLLNAIKKF